MSPFLGTYASQISGHLETGAFESIATAVGTGSNTTITFSSIPSTFKHLQVRMLAKDTYNGGGALVRYTPLVINGDTGANYTRHNINGDGSAVTVQGFANTSRIEQIGCVVDSGTGATNTFGVGIVDILDYSNTTKYKTVRAFGGGDINAAGGFVRLQSGLWQSTSAITSLTFNAVLNFFTSTTTFSLYGIKG
jgi:hypothetical protein